MTAKSQQSDSKAAAMLQSRTLSFHIKNFSEDIETVILWRWPHQVKFRNVSVRAFAVSIIDFLMHAQSKRSRIVSRIKCNAFQKQLQEGSAG